MQCTTCNGKGRVIASAKMVGRPVNIETNCPDCQGTGKIHEPGICQRCNGSKKVVLPAEESPLKIPMEVDCPECNRTVILSPK